MTIIQLSQNKTSLIDDHDAEAVNKFKWHFFSGYAVRSLYKHPSGKNKEFLHNFLMGPGEGLEVDHIDGNPLNNQRENLRVCTHAQNNRNRKRAKNNTSGYKGVSFHKNTGRWQAALSLGLYSSKEEAALAFDKAAIAFFGEYASLNFPQKSPSAH